MTGGQHGSNCGLLDKDITMVMSGKDKARLLCSPSLNLKDAGNLRFHFAAGLCPLEVVMGINFAFNHFSTTGRCSGPPCCDTWRRQVTRAAIVTSSFKIFLFSIAFVMSVIEKFAEFLNTLTMQYELRYKWWINVVVIIFICASLSLLIILLPEYHYFPILKIMLCCWNLYLKWHSRFSYKVAVNAVLSDHSTVGL